MESNFTIAGRGNHDIACAHTQIGLVIAPKWRIAMAQDMENSVEASKQVILSRTRLSPEEKSQIRRYVEAERNNPGEFPNRVILGPEHRDLG